MRPFQYERAGAPAEALAALARGGNAAFLAGGTTMLDLMKLDVLTPARLIDINPLPQSKIEATPAGLSIGALARMSDVAAHPEVAKGYPVIAEALLASASPQLRNMASIGGNLLQKTRCTYYRDVAWACNKRTQGAGCSAIDGEHRMHAILGTSEHCIATHPSDLAVALLALDATVEVEGPGGARSIPLADFHTLPGATPNIETTLRHDELIVSVKVPASGVAARSHYLKVRDRASYEFALVSVAAALRIEGGKVAECRVALGGVGTKPWRVPEAEAAAIGSPAGVATYKSLADAALKGAITTGQNGFKAELARRTIVRALTTLGGAA